jgi:hypothetical protein
VEGTVQDEMTDPTPDGCFQTDAVTRGIAKTVIAHVAKPRDVYVSEWNWASEAGHPCLRFLAYRRLYPERALAHSEELAFIFRHGKYMEDEALDDLKSAGYELVEQQRSFTDRKLRCKGKIDAKIVLHTNGRTGKHPLEIKAYAPTTFARIHKVSDFIESDLPYLQTVPAQLTLYLMLDETAAREGILFIKNKLTSIPKEIVVPIDQKYGLWIWRRLRIVNDHVRRKKLPPRIPFEENVCGRCPFRATCLQEMPAGPSPLVLDPEKMSDLMDLLAEREKLDPMRKTFEEVDARVKEIVRGHPKVIVGDWIVSGKEIEQHRLDTKAMPDDVKKQYSKAVTYWRTSIVNVRKPAERED